MTNKKFGGVVLAAGALIVFSVLMLMLRHHSPSMRQRLPDGSYLQLCKVECEVGHGYAYGRKIERWNSWVYRHLPIQLALSFDCEPFGGGSLAIPSTFITNYASGLPTLGFATNLAAFAVFEGRTNSPYSFLRLVVSDDGGNTWDAGFSRGTCGNTDGAFHCELDGWIAPQPPPQAKRLTLRFYKALKKDSPCVAEFVVTNPAPTAMTVTTTYRIINEHTNIIDVQTN
jgi:hypothetical protein